MNSFALIGCGRIAKRHAENIARVGRLVAVCDVVPQRADDFALRYGAKAYYSIEDLLQATEKFEMVVVCTPNGFHAEHIIKSLQARKHVLTEKPLCLTTAAAWQIIETEKFCRRRLFVVKSARYTQVLQQLLALLLKQVLGTIYSFHISCIWNRPDAYYTEWRGKLFPDGGTLYNQFSHYVDAILWLFGPIEHVKGFAANAAHQNSIEFEDTGTAALQMKSGTLGTFHWSVNAYQQNHEISLTVVAQKGLIQIGGEYLNQVIHSRLEDPAWFSTPAADEDGKSGAQGNSHFEMYNHLLRALHHGADDFAGAFEGLQTVAAIEAIYKAVAPPAIT